MDNSIFIFVGLICLVILVPVIIAGVTAVVAAIAGTEEDSDEE